jgi:DNA-binding transcriptional LysR family regulator
MADMFNWNDLRVFVEVARQGTLAGAARRLRIDHTTVGRRINELEQALNVKLFDRTATGYILTEAGHRLLSPAAQIEEGAIGISESVGKSTDFAGTVRVATMEGIGSYYIAPNLPTFHARHPSIIVELVTSSHLLNLTKREADISLSFFRPEGPRLVTRKIGQFDLRLYGAPSYLERHGEPRTIDDLSRHLFVDYIDDLVAIPAVRWLRDVIPKPRVAFHSTSMLAQQNAAAAGLGLVLLPSFTAARDPRLRPVLTSLVSVKRELWLSVHEELRLLARIRAVMTFLTDLVDRDREFLDGLRTGPGASAIPAAAD